MCVKYFSQNKEDMNKTYHTVEVLFNTGFSAHTKNGESIEVGEVRLLSLTKGFRYVLIEGSTFNTFYVYKQVLHIP